MPLNTQAILDAERVHYLTSEHDKRVEEYRELEAMLPTTAERLCMAHVATLAAGTHSARVVARYLERIAAR